MRSTFCRFNENIIGSVSTDKTFALWDINNRDAYGVPSFLRKVEIPNKVSIFQLIELILIAELDGNNSG